ncbi:MAG: hypothetical protein A4E32_01304 [Methanomassiliicoccales archaeon PtaU1.Bin124]|nr:MAG: hypothetical protein A4E32_01304 [Methanomassiliicoccales archaeon PtaU1.Bin124]
MFKRLSPMIIFINIWLEDPVFVQHGMVYIGENTIWFDHFSFGGYKLFEERVEGPLQGIVKRERRIMVGALLLCCALFLVFSAPNASAAGPTYVSSDITANTTWTASGSPYIVTANITVAQGITLTIAQDVVVLVNYDTLITVNGSLVVNGAAGHDVVMTANTTGMAWQGISASKTSALNLNHLQFDNASGIISYNDVLIDSSRFVDISNTGILWLVENQSAGLTVTNSYFRHVGYLALDMIHGAINANTILTQQASYVNPVVITGNMFDGGQGSDVVQIDISVMANDGSSVSLDSNIIFDDNRFNNTESGSAVGFYLSRNVITQQNGTATFFGDVTVRDNEFDDLTNAVVLSDIVQAIGIYQGTITVTGDVELSGNIFGEYVVADLTLQNIVIGFGSSSISYHRDAVVTGNVMDGQASAISYTRMMNGLDNSTLTSTGDLTVELNNFKDIESGVALTIMDQAVYSGDYNGTVVLRGDQRIIDNSFWNISQAMVNAISLHVCLGWGEATIDSSMTVAGNQADEMGSYVLLVQSVNVVFDNASLFCHMPYDVSGNNVTTSLGLIYYTQTFEAHNDATSSVITPLNIDGNEMGTTGGTPVYIYNSLTLYDRAIGVLDEGLNVANSTVDGSMSSLVQITVNLSANDNSTFTMDAAASIVKNTIATAINVVRPTLNFVANHYSMVNVTAPLSLDENKADVANVNVLMGQLTAVSNMRAKMTVDADISVDGNTIGDCDYVVSYLRTWTTNDNSTMSVHNSISASDNRLTTAAGMASVSTTLTALDGSSLDAIGPVVCNRNVVDRVTAIAVHITTTAIFHDDAMGEAMLGTAVSENIVDDSAADIFLETRAVDAADNAVGGLMDTVVVSSNEIKHGTSLVLIVSNVESRESSKLKVEASTFIGDNVAEQLTSNAIIFNPLGFRSMDGSRMNVSADVIVSNNQILVKNGFVLMLDRNFEAIGSSSMNVLAGVDIEGNTFLLESIAGNALAIEDSIGTGLQTGSTLVMTGEVAIVSNMIKGANGSGIYYDIKVNPNISVGGENEFDLSRVNYLITENDIELTGAGARGIVWSSDLDKMNQVYYGDLTLRMGSVEISRNTITLAGDYATGIQLVQDVRAWARQGGTITVEMKGKVVDGNTVGVEGNNGIGIWLSAPYLYARGDHSNATVVTGELSAFNNVISMTGDQDIGLRLTTGMVRSIAVGDHDHSVIAFAEIAGGINLVQNVISVDGADCNGIHVGEIDASVTSNGYLCNATLICYVNIADNVIETRNVGGSEWTHGIYVSPLIVQATYSASYSLVQIGIVVDGNGVEQTGPYTCAIHVTGMNAYEVDHSSFIGNAWIMNSVVVADNSIVGGEYGVFLDHSDFEILVLRNIAQKTYTCGIACNDSTLCVLEDNLALDNFGTGIGVYDCGYIVLRDNSALNNDGYGLLISGSDFIKIYNGRYEDNSDQGLRTEASYATWYVDVGATLLSNDAQLNGDLYVMDGGILTIDLCRFVIGNGADGNHELVVELGGQIVARNTDLYSSGSSNALFVVYGALTYIGGTVENWYEVYLAPTSVAEIGGVSFFDMERYGIHVDNCSPRIANCLLSGSGLAGMFIEGTDAGASVENCVFFMNPKGIYAVDANLGEVVGNTFTVNTVAGIFGEKVTGTISANTFFLNKDEIYLTRSSVVISDNEIGYSHLIDIAAEFAPVASVIVNYLAGMVDANVDLNGVPTSSGPSTSYAAYVASLIMDHDGIVASDSTIECRNNVYGPVSWAVFAKNSTVIFSDSVKTGTLVLTWLNGNFVPAMLEVPLKAMNGVYAKDSNVVIDGAEIVVMDTAVLLSSSTGTIRNSQLLADQYDLYAVGNSTVQMIDTVLDGKVGALGEATVKASYQLDILTIDAKGNIVTGVKVTVRDAKGVLVGSGVSDATGHFKCTATAFEIVNGNRDTSMNPYVVEVEFSNGKVTQEVGVTSSTSLIVAANVDNTPLYVGIVVIAAVILLLGAAVLLRRKN